MHAAAVRGTGPEASVTWEMQEKLRQLRDGQTREKAELAAEFRQWAYEC